MENEFTVIQHVDKIGLEHPPKNSAIWNWALKNHFIIVTNDENFLNLTTTKGFPPKIILLRTGNMSTQQVAHLLIKHKEDIQELEKTKEYGVLQLY
ncbi:DUF5615 family PIN-like protein [Catalinimonas sp. 4WD22]|uniref:DUF5615 family PIN-like protein n=1 Tax=Catalinimonas locisalis TaxID=3133978 RepID=UPI003100D93B